MRDYWVLVKDGTDPDFELVPDGFSWGALVFQFLWALYRRLWRVLLGLVAVVFVLGVIVGAAGLDTTWASALNIAVAVALGWFGNDLRRWELGRKGFRAADIVRARRLADAELLAIARWADRRDAEAPPEPSPEPPRRESELV
jgi:hypothetical protein